MGREMTVVQFTRPSRENTMGERREEATRNMNTPTHVYIRQQFFFTSTFNLSERRAPEAADVLQLHTQSSSLCGEAKRGWKKSAARRRNCPCIRRRPPLPLTSSGAPETPREDPHCTVHSSSDCFFQCTTARARVRFPLCFTHAAVHLLVIAAVGISVGKMSHDESGSSSS